MPGACGVRRCLSALALCLLSACASEAAREGVTVRDSAGITIVENDIELGTLPEVTIASDPELRIGAIDGPPEYQFSDVTEATRLPDGRIVVLDRALNEVRIFDETGNALVSFGGEGEGPEQFNWPQAVWLVAPDTLLIHDAFNRRLARWTTSGAFIRVQAFDPPATSTGTALGRAADYIIVSRMESLVPALGGQAWFPFHIERYTLDGALVDTITSLPGSEWATREFRGRAGTAGVRFGARAEIRPLGDGLVIARGQEPVFEIRSLDGAPLRSIRWVDRDDREVRPEHLDRALEELLPDDADAEMRRLAKAQFGLFPAADRFPTLADVGISTNGEIWVQRFRRPGEPKDAVFLVFSGEGELLRRVRLPEGLEVFEAGADYVLGVERDELDVPYVVLYRFADGR